MLIEGVVGACSAVPSVTPTCMCSHAPRRWIPCVVFAHAFALFWLAKLIITLHPRASSWAARLGRSQRARDARRPQRLPISSPEALAAAPPGSGQVPEGCRALIRRLTTEIEPLTLTWEGVGCVHRGAHGDRVALQVRDRMADGGCCQEQGGG